MLSGFLPIGTVVLLKEGAKRLMIAGILQRDTDSGRLWEYVGVLYPEGYVGAKDMYLFNGDAIDKIYALGYQDAEQFDFKEMADQKYLEIIGAAHANAESDEEAEEEAEEAPEEEE